MFNIYFTMNKTLNKEYQVFIEHSIYIFISEKLNNNIFE